MAHRLKLEIEDIFQDPKFIRVADWSEYERLIPVTNRVIKVDVPGQETFRLIKVPVNGSFTYTSKGLKLSTSLEDLPDGLWTFTLSVCPNERLFTVVSHFRTVVLENRIMAHLAKLLTGEEQFDFNQAMVDCLLKIRALKTNSVDLFNVKKAYALYRSVESKMSRYCLNY